MAEQTSIFNTIIDAVYDRLVDQVIDEVSESADADLNMPFRSVLKGKYHGDPFISEAVVNVKSGAENWSHTLNLESAKSGFEGLPYEFPGQVHNRLRFVVEFRVSFNADTTEAEAQRKAHLAMSRINWALWTMDTGLGPDSFGESTWGIELNNFFIIESGTDGKLWRGETWITFFTDYGPVTEQ